MLPGLPSPPALTGMLLLFTACEAEPPVQIGSDEIPPAYLERLQEAEAVRYSIEQHDLEQARLEQLLGGDQARRTTR